MSVNNVGKSEAQIVRLKAGMERTSVKGDAKMESIFDKVDTDHNGVIDETEIQKFKANYDSNTDDKITKKEAKNFIADNGLKDEKIKNKDVIKFLQNWDINTENVKDSQILEDGAVEITYNDGSQKIVNPDKSYNKITQDNGETITKSYDDKDILQKERIETEEQTTETIYDEDGKNPLTSTIDNTQDGTHAEIKYEDGKPASKTVEQGNDISYYEYLEDGNERITSKIENKGNDVLEKKTEYQYGKDGTSVATITQQGKTTVQQYQDEKLLQEDITEGDKVTQRLYNYDQGVISEKTTDGNSVTGTLYDLDNNRLAQTKEKNGVQYNINYDGNGNTTGVIVQNGESINAIAKRFGVSVNALVAANEDKVKGTNQKYFDVGEEIKIPRELDADDKALQGRKPAEVAKEEYARDVEIQRQKAEAAKQEQEYYQKLGVKNFKDKGKKVKADGWGSKEFEVIGDVKFGRQLVKRDNKLYTMSHDGKILREDYLQAHNAFVNKPEEQRNNTASGMKDVTYVKDNNGKVWYFDEKTGKAIVKDGYKDVVKQESAFVADQLYTAAKGLGTDEELLQKGLENIYSRDILQSVNAELRTKDSDYAGDAQTMPVEALILDENSHQASIPFFQTLINSGTMTTEEKAHTVKREMEYEVHGGVFGHTSASNLNGIMQLCSERDVRLEIEAQFKKDYPELSENGGSFVRSYIAADGWNAQEVDQFDANWISSGAYQEARCVYRTDENGSIVLDNNGQPVVVLDEGDQGHINEVLDRLVFDYQNKEALNKGLNAANSNENSATYQHLMQRAGEEVAKDPQGKYQERFSDQDVMQRYLAGFHSDGSGDVDIGNLSASNTLFYKGEKPPRIQAEEALYRAKNGDYDQTFDSMNAETYTAMSELIAKGDVKGVKNVGDLYNKALDGAKNYNDKTKIRANAILSGQVNFTDEEIADFCIELMHSIDANKGCGGSTGMSAGYTNSADYQTEQLKAILQNNPQVMDTVKERVEGENFSYTTTTQVNRGPELQPTVRNITTNTKESYLQLIADTKHIVQDEVFYDAKGNEITDPEQIKAIKKANMESLEQMRQCVAELERDYKKGVDTEGLLSGAVNELSKYSGIGTDREDVATEYRNAKLMLQQFEAAAQGRLRDSQGNVISAQDLAKQMLDKQNALAEANSDYKQTIAYGKMGMVLGPVILATTVASGGAAAAGWGTLGVALASGAAATATTYGVNALEYNTSNTGNTTEAREQNLEDSLVNGAATAVGIGQVKILNSLGNGVVRAAANITADTLTGATLEYVETGNVTTEGTLTNMMFSGMGNVIGLKSENRGKTTPAHENNVHSTPAGRDPIHDGAVAREADAKYLNANKRGMIEQGLKDTPAPEELTAYQKEHGYQAPAPEQQAALDDLHAQNAKTYSEAHQIQNNAVIEKQKTTPLSGGETAIKTLEDEVKSIDGQIRMLNKKIFGAKKMGKNTTELETQRKNLQAKKSAKAAELESLNNPVKVEAESGAKAEDLVSVEPEILAAEPAAQGTETPAAAVKPDVKANAKDNKVKVAAGKAPELTPGQKYEMTEISGDVVRAKTPDSLEKAQKRLDKMPECPQKSALQRQLNERREQLAKTSEVEDVRVVAQVIEDPNMVVGTPEGEVIGTSEVEDVRVVAQVIEDPNMVVGTPEGEVIGTSEVESVQVEYVDLDNPGKSVEDDQVLRELHENRSRDREMGDIFSSLVVADTEEDLSLVESMIERMPECPQKDHLRVELNQKRAELRNLAKLRNQERAALRKREDAEGMEDAVKDMMDDIKELVDNYGDRDSLSAGHPEDGYGNSDLSNPESSYNPLNGYEDPLYNDQLNVDSDQLDMGGDYF